MSFQDMDAVETGRVDTDSKWFELYQKGIELGTWDAGKLVEQMGVEEDKAVWASLEPEEKEQWARLIAAFVDLEHAVAEDGRRIIEQMGSPYLDESIEKEMYATVFAMTEAKHTQFFDMYINTVMDDVFPDTHLDIRRGGQPLPRTSACGMSKLGERQGAKMALAANGGDPVDIARAATTYHMMVEGIAARGGYFLKNNMMAESPLPLLNKGFQFVSTDEGRHVTHGLELLSELLEKERAGIPEYQGVDEAIWEESLACLPHVIDTAYFVSAAMDDPLGADFDGLIQRGMELWHAQFKETLDLEHYAPNTFSQVAQGAANEADETDYDGRIEHHAATYARKLDLDETDVVTGGVADD
ncbi:ribonucleotide-diphosphate reductase subunit beta [Halorientalis halophila]|uniref:ribonucleotide-diphosphate reductase subunit beta n=1 Tax=Halorientalis halophila TaxID=3108499 RepID=UPI003008E640